MPFNISFIDGALPVSQGGTGSTTQSGAISGLLPTQTGNSGRVLSTNGTTPSWIAVSGTGTVTDVSVATANGVSAVTSNSTTTPAITFTLGNITPNNIIATGTVSGVNLSGINTGDQIITVTGAITGVSTGSGGSTAIVTTIANQVVTFAKMQNIATASLLGRATTGTGSPEIITLGAGLAFTGGALTSTSLNTSGNLTEATSSILNIVGGTGSVGGSGITIEVRQANTSQAGFLSSANWNTFNNKQNALGFTPAVQTSGTSILKGNGSGDFSSATAGIDYEVPLTFSTGLTKVANTVTVNTTQNLLRLSNLTTNGFVRTTGGDGSLSVDTNAYATSANPQISGIVKDINGNNWLGVLTSTSAVNYFAMQNRASGSGVLLSAQGPDATIDIAINPKGTTGRVFLGGAGNGTAALSATSTNTVSNKYFNNTNFSRGLGYQDDTDFTKQMTLSLAGITTGTTRTLTVPNASGTIALTSDITATNSYRKIDITGASDHLLSTDNYVIISFDNTPGNVNIYLPATETAGQEITIKVSKNATATYNSRVNILTNNPTGQIDNKSGNPTPTSQSPYALIVPGSSIKLISKSTITGMSWFAVAMDAKTRDISCSIQTTINPNIPTIPSAAWTKVSFIAGSPPIRAKRDIFQMMTLSGIYNSQFIIPVTGHYSISFSAKFVDALSGNSAGASIYVNGTLSSLQQFFAKDASGRRTALFPKIDVFLLANDIVEYAVFQDSSGNLNIIHFAGYIEYAYSDTLEFNI